MCRFYVQEVAGTGGWGHMGAGGWMWFWAPVMMLFWIAVVAILVWLVTRTWSEHRRPSTLHGTEPSIARAREILAERYARGEISTEEYEEHLARLN